MAVTRGFSGRRARDHRLPPGQYDAGDQWPVLHAEATPSIDVAGWTFTLDSLVSRPTTCTWELAEAGPAANAAYVLARPHTGYTTNLPLDDATGGKAWVVWDVTAAPCATSTAVPRGCSSLTCTSGRARNGCRDSA